MNNRYQLIDNEEEGQYEYRIEGHTPFIAYIKPGNNEIYLTHTEVPYELEGQGVGTVLVKDTLTDIEEKGLRLVPMCPFIAGYIQKNPEWRRIVLR